MTVNEMRQYLLSCYPSTALKWRKRVSEMPTNQVIAVYRSMIERRNKTHTSYKERPKEQYHQMDIFEYLISINPVGNTTQIMASEAPVEV